MRMFGFRHDVLPVDVAVIAETQEQAEAHAAKRGWTKLEGPRSEGYEMKPDVTPSTIIKMFDAEPQLRAVLCQCCGEPAIAICRDDEGDYEIELDKDATVDEQATRGYSDRTH